MKNVEKGRMSLFCTCLCSALALSATFLATAGEEPDPKPPLTLTLLVEDGELYAELKNVSDRPVSIITKLQHGWGAVTLQVTDRNGKSQEGRIYVDWMVSKPGDVEVLRPCDVHRCPVKTSVFRLNPGQYEVRATYRISSDSFFFVKSWFDATQDDEISERPVGALGERMTRLWFGSVESKPVTLEVRQRPPSEGEEKKDGGEKK